MFGNNYDCSGEEEEEDENIIYDSSCTYVFMGMSFERATDRVIKIVIYYASKDSFYFNFI